MDLIGAINELKRDKKLKIENQRKIETLKEETRREVELSEKIRENKFLLSQLQEELRLVKAEFSDSGSSKRSNSKVRDLLRSPAIRTGKKTTGKDLIRRTRVSNNLLLSNATSFDLKPKMNKSPSLKLKSDIILPPINTIFAKKHKTGIH